MSGPNPPEPDSEGTDDPQREPEPTAEQDGVQDATGETEIHSRAYSAPESEQFTAGPYVAADPDAYDYDEYDKTELVDGGRPPRWPWVVGVVAIIAAIALVVSVSLLVMGTESDNLNAQGGPTSSTTTTPPVQDEITTTTPPPPPPPPPPSEEPPPPPPETVTVTEPPPAPAPPPEEAPPPPPEEPPTSAAPPPTTTRAGPRQVTYSVTGTKAPGDIITVTYIDASGRSRTQRNVYIPWSLTVTPISQSEVGSVQASSLFLVSRLNCSITTSDGTVLSSNTGNSAQTSC
jgi:hypothetical protein